MISPVVVSLISSLSSLLNAFNIVILKYVSYISCLYYISLTNTLNQAWCHWPYPLSTNSCPQTPLIGSLYTVRSKMRLQIITVTFFDLWGRQINTIGSSGTYFLILLVLCLTSLSRGLHRSPHGTQQSMWQAHWTMHTFRDGHAVFSLHVYPSLASEAFPNSGLFEISYLALSRCVSLL